MGIREREVTAEERQRTGSSEEKTRIREVL